MFILEIINFDATYKVELKNTLFVSENVNTLIEAANGFYREDLKNNLLISKSSKKLEWSFEKGISKSMNFQTSKFLYLETFYRIKPITKI